MLWAGLYLGLGMLTIALTTFSDPDGTNKLDGVSLFRGAALLLMTWPIWRPVLVGLMLASRDSRSKPDRAETDGSVYEKATIE